MAREGIGWGELCTREDFPGNIKVLEKEEPVRLPVGEFAGVLNIGQVLVVGDDSDWVRCSLDILPPFREGKDVREEFVIIDIIVPFSGEEGPREVSTGVEIAIDISLEQDGAHCK